MGPIERHATTATLRAAPRSKGRGETFDGWPRKRDEYPASG